MIEVPPDSRSNRLGVRLSGKVNAEDRTSTYVPKVDEILNSYNFIRLLVQLDEDFAGVRSSRQGAGGRSKRRAS